VATDDKIGSRIIMDGERRAWVCGAHYPNNNWGINQIIIWEKVIWKGAAV